MVHFYLVDGVELQTEDLVNSLAQAEHVCDDVMIKHLEATTAAGAIAAASAALLTGGGGTPLPPFCGPRTVYGGEAQRVSWELRWRTRPRQSSLTIPNKFYACAIDDEVHTLTLGTRGVPRSRQPLSADGKRRNHGPRWGQAPAHHPHEVQAAGWRGDGAAGVERGHSKRPCLRHRRPLRPDSCVDNSVQSSPARVVTSLLNCGRLRGRRAGVGGGARLLPSFRPMTSAGHLGVGTYTRVTSRCIP